MTAPDWDYCIYMGKNLRMLTRISWQFGELWTSMSSKLKWVPEYLGLPRPTIATNCWHGFLAHFELEGERLFFLGASNLDLVRLDAKHPIEIRWSSLRLRETWTGPMTEVHSLRCSWCERTNRRPDARCPTCNEPGPEHPNHPPFLSGPKTYRPVNPNGRHLNFHGQYRNALTNGEWRQEEIIQQMRELDR